MATSNIIKSIRNLRVLVLHPRDSHAEQLLQQVRRIGCQAEAIWPLPERLPEHVDMVFVEVTESPSRALHQLVEKDVEERPTVIGVVSYENPSVLEALLEMRADAVLTKPLRPSGVLSSMVLARRIWEDFRRSQRALNKLKAKVKNTQTVSQAKFILMRLHQIPEDEAYSIIRSQAMAKRATTVEIAQAIINADGILGNISAKKVDPDKAR
ncbi:MAG: ANTAR domain-containing protein [Arhodomonas sp.]|nr:ANTAR domain-containing protein [Arhodomonas sp.]